MAVQRPQRRPRRILAPQRVDEPGPPNHRADVQCQHRHQRPLPRPNQIGHPERPTHLDHAQQPHRRRSPHPTPPPAKNGNPDNSDTTATPHNSPSRRVRRGVGGNEMREGPAPRGAGEEAAQGGGGVWGRRMRIRSVGCGDQWRGGLAEDAFPVMGCANYTRVGCRVNGGWVPEGYWRSWLRKGLRPGRSTWVVGTRVVRCRG